MHIFYASFFIVLHYLPTSSLTDLYRAYFHFYIQGSQLIFNFSVSFSFSLSLSLSLSCFLCFIHIYQIFFLFFIFYFQPVGSCLLQFVCRVLWVRSNSNSYGPSYFIYLSHGQTDTKAFPGLHHFFDYSLGFLLHLTSFFPSLASFLTSFLISLASFLPTLSSFPSFLAFLPSFLP